MKEGRVQGNSKRRLREKERNGRRREGVEGERGKQEREGDGGSRT